MTQLHLILLSVTSVFLLTVLGVKLLLPKLQKKHAVQVILEIGPSWHKSKEGTPTMGGLAPLLACLIVGAILTPLLGKSANIAPFVFTLLFAVANASVGILDDATKVWKARNLGLTPGQKLMLQSTFAIAYLTLLKIYGICDTRLPIPFTQISPDLGWFWYPICFLLLLWFVNCANLTDGIDGLASTVAALIGVFLVLAALFLSSVSATCIRMILQVTGS
jgi:phospho-N-acetylmuramoyl-pentapeptide-transferase